MLYRHPYHTAVVALIAVIVCLVIGPTSMLLAQETDRKEPRSASIPNVPVFKGSGGPRDATIPEVPVTAPKALRLDVIREIAHQIGSEPGSTFVKLTPQQPYVANRGALYFYKFTQVASWENFARLDRNDGLAKVALLLRPAAAGSKYLIDCAVTAYGTEKFTLQQGFNSATVSPIEGRQHLIFLVEDASPSNVYYFYVSNSAGFQFFSCEVTILR